MSQIVTPFQFVIYTTCLFHLSTHFARPNPARCIPFPFSP
eukprot:UN10655